jgi:hypothetical protein
MMLKYASATILSAELGAQSLTLRTAHRAEFSYQRRPGYLYVRTRAISSRCNDNFDDFPAIEIKGDNVRTGYRTFIGKPAFVNHVNDNHRRARGVIVDAALHEDVNPDGTPDVWVELLHEVDARAFPKLTARILKGEITTTSMGCDVEYSICSYCGNRASTPLEYCAHIPRLKGKRIRRVTASGQPEDVLVREICHGLRFFENSFLVEDPADPTAFVLDVDDSHINKAAKRLDTPAGGAVTSLQESLEGDTMALRLAARESEVAYVSSGSLARTRRIVMEAALSAPVPTEADVAAHAERLARSSRNNGDDRGSSYQRRARSEWLIAHYGYRGVCGCMWCGRKLTVDTVTADRFYPGRDGGRYIRENVGPACVSCNSGRAAQSFFEAAKRWAAARQSVEVAV